MWPLVQVQQRFARYGAGSKREWPPMGKWKFEWFSGTLEETVDQMCSVFQ